MTEQTVVTLDLAASVPARMASNTVTPMDMLDRAIASGAGIDVLTKLMDLQERWERNQSRRAFDAAIAAAKAELPIVLKASTGHNNKRYADFATYARAIDPVITRHGLSYRFRTKQDDRIHVTCVLSHRDGHSEENTLAGPADTSGSKNAIQAIGSTLTYLQRYSLVQALGLAASEDDDGSGGSNGNGSGPVVEHDDGRISAAQMKTLQGAIVESAIDIKKVTDYAKVDRLEDIPARHFDKVMHAVKNYKPNREKK